MKASVFRVVLFQGDLCQHLAVEVQTGGLQPVNKLAVGNAGVAA